jgi:hypothetical protein
MKHLAILIILFIATCIELPASENAIGGRISNDMGITFKHHYKSNTWLEGIIDIEGHALVLSGLYEKYYLTPFSNNFNWFAGGGVYLGYWGYANSSSTYAGIKGVGGLCYTLNDLPVEISIDWMPAIQIVKVFNTDFNIFGLSIRYTF